jgi:hemerythrin-like domain-containing protein
VTGSPVSGGAVSGTPAHGGPASGAPADPDRAPAGPAPAARLPRRALLLGAGGLAAGGAAGAAIALAAAPGGAAAGQLDAVAAQVPLTEDLMQEHGLLVRLVLAYREGIRRAAAGEPLPAAPLHDAALIIHDYIEAFHEPLEEGYIFPRLARSPQLGGTVTTLLLQHARGRQQTQLILADTTPPAAVVAPAARPRLPAAMTAFVAMYEPHEAREDTVIYPAFRAAVSPREIVQLGAHFADLERQQFGPDGFTAMLGRVDRIEQALGIYDLAQFTPPDVAQPG